MVLFVVLGLLIAILAVIFALQNITPVTISLFFWEVSGSLSLVLLLALGIGVLIGLLIMAPSAIRHRMAASGLRKQQAKLEKELEALQQKLSRLETPAPSPAPAAPAQSKPEPAPETPAPAAEQAGETALPAPAGDEPEMN